MAADVAVDADAEAVADPTLKPAPSVLGIMFKSVSDSTKLRPKLELGFGNAALGGK